MSYTFVQGAVAPIDKDSARAKNGDFAVVTSVSNTLQNNVATVMVFGTEEHADAMSKHVVTAPGSVDSGANEAQFKQLASHSSRTLREVNKLSTHSLTSEWARFADPMHAPHGERLNALDYVGREMQANAMPIFNEDMTILRFQYSGTVKVVEAHPHSLVSITFETDSETHRIKCALGLLSRQLIVAPQQPAPEPMTVDDDDATAVTVELPQRARAYPVAKLIKSLPISTTLGEHELDGSEILDTATAAGIEHGVKLSDGFVESFMVLTELHTLFERGGECMHARTYTAHSAQRLGRQIKQGLPTASATPDKPATPPKPQWPLVDALKGLLADPADFPLVLTSSIAVTATGGKRELAEGDPYLANGLLESYLKQSMVSTERLSGMTGGMSKSQLILFIMELAPTASDKGSERKESIHIDFNPNGPAINEAEDTEESRQKRRLRADASVVFNDRDLTQRLQGYHTMAQKDPNGLRFAIDQEVDVNLKRLLTSDGAIGLACHGASRSLSPNPPLEGKPRGLTGSTRIERLESCPCACSTQLKLKPRIRMERA